MNLNQNALNQGAAAGALVVVVKLIAYIIGIDAYMSTPVSLGALVFVIAGMCIACIATRKMDGHLTFQDAFRTAWLASAVATGVVLVFEVLLFALIDPEMSTKVVDFTVESMQNDLSGFMAMSDSIIEETRASMLWWSGAGGKSIGWLIGLAFWAVVSAIVGAAFKRNAADAIR
jgi:hypothetical protein